MTQINLLDHGYLSVVETWGSDERIIESARMSTNKGFEGWGPIHSEYCDITMHGPTGNHMNTLCTCTPKAGDEKLLKFLYEHKHSTPFEMGGMTIEVQAPIFVFREWMRHRTQSYSELSARYTQMPNIHYLPARDRVKVQSTTNKQASADELIAPEIYDEWINKVKQEQDLIYANYEWALSKGIAKEIARVNTPVSRYSRMRASANLRNWIGFLALRMPVNAQWEIRMYANALASMLDMHFPRTMELFREGQSK